MRFRLGELAEWVAGEVSGDPELIVEGIRALEDAGPRDLSLLVHPRYRDQALESRAGVLLVERGSRLAQGLERPLLLVDDPSLALALLLERFHPPERPPAGVHPTAVVEAGSEVAPSAHVGPYAVVGARSRVEEEAVLEAHVVVGRDCRVGRASWLHPHVVLYDGTQLGQRVIVHSGTVLGADGFGYATHGGVHHKVPQVGRVEIEDDVEVGALTAIDRATLGATRVGAGCKIDNLVQLGHNVQVGPASLLCGQVGIAGSTRLGAGVVMAGRAGASGHLTLGDRVQVAADSVALGSVEAGQTVSGTPAVPMARWRRQVVLLSRLEEMQRRLRAVEKRLAAAGGEPEPEEG